MINEKLEKYKIVTTVVAVGGIYLLTMNKQNLDDDTSYGYSILGYLLAFSSAWLFGGIFVCIRYLTQNGVHPIMSSFCVGIGITIQTGIALPLGLLHLDQYDRWDILLLALIGVTNYLGQAAMALANKYSQASKMSPFNNLEIVMTILADIMIFKYVFLFTDIVGIIIILA